MISLIAKEKPKSPVSEAYRMIRTNVQFSGIGKAIKTVLLTSSIPNEGKTTVVTNLGIVMAQAGYKTIIVDCDFRNPSQHKLFNVPNKGLSNRIALGAEVDDIIQESGVPNLHVLTSGPVAPNPSEILDSADMTKLLRILEESYDYILLDSPPVLPVTDAVILSNKVDGTILVVGWGSVTPNEAKIAKERLTRGGAHILGAVLNRVEATTSKYGYGHGYGYGYYDYYGEDREKAHKHKEDEK